MDLQRPLIAGIGLCGNTGLRGFQRNGGDAGPAARPLETAPTHRPACARRGGGHQCVADDAPARAGAQLQGRHRRRQDASRNLARPPSFLLNLWATWCVSVPQGKCRALARPAGEARRAPAFEGRGPSTSTRRDYRPPSPQSMAERRPASPASPITAGHEAAKSVSRSSRAAGKGDRQCRQRCWVDRKGLARNRFAPAGPAEMGRPRTRLARWVQGGDPGKMNGRNPAIAWSKIAADRGPPWKNVPFSKPNWPA